MGQNRTKRREKVEKKKCILQKKKTFSLQVFLAFKFLHFDIVSKYILFIHFK